MEAQAIVSRDGLYVIDPTRCFSVASHWNVKLCLDIYAIQQDIQSDFNE